MNEIDFQTREAIEKRTRIALKDAGITDPPANADDLLQSLSLYREYYNLEDPGLLRRVGHNLHVGSRRIIRIARKIDLRALLFQREAQILVDSSLHDRKKTWACFHEITHKILPWHKYFYIGDTAQTLDPFYRERLDLEANYGASDLIFCGQSFTKMALDTTPCLDSVDLLRKKFRTSYTATTRRYVEHSHELPMALLISIPNWHDVSDGMEERCRYFIKSKQFKKKFSGISEEVVLSEIDSNTTKRRGGIVGVYEMILPDDNNVLHEFLAESFYNQYDIISLIVYRKKV